MTFFIVTFLAGVLTIATPCIFPILPFVLARAGGSFRRRGLPMLIGLAITFAAVASLAAVAGGWAVEANRYGRTIALLAMTLFGLTMLSPWLAMWMMRPIVALGARLAVGPDAGGASSLLVGVATGLVWAPCAGPVLGLILTGAALRGPSLETSLLLLTYGAGAATALAAGVWLSARLLATARRWVRWSDRLRPFVGAAVILGAASIWLRLDTGLLTRWSSGTVTMLEQTLLGALRKEPAVIIHSARAEPVPVLSPRLTALLGARQWLNTLPLQPEDLRGRVVLVNFWTYSCINCLRMLPHVRAWAEAYGEQGLLVVGVHTPEFAFEKDVTNVSRALRPLGVTWPVAIDSDFRIWRAFGNQSWPALYFIGTDGRVRHQALGEGNYAQSEQLIRTMLAEATAAPVSVPPASAGGTGAQAEADERNLRSGETYVGYAQSHGFASPGGVRQDVAASYQVASPLPIGRWGLAGAWTVGEEFATSSAPSGRIVYRFHARDLHLVLAPAAPGEGIRFRVTLDGVPPGADHGADTDADGRGTVQDGRLYQLIRQSGPVKDRLFEIEFIDAGVRAYAFTFG